MYIYLYKWYIYVYHECVYRYSKLDNIHGAINRISKVGSFFYLRDRTKINHHHLAGMYVAAIGQRYVNMIIKLSNYSYIRDDITTTSAAVTVVLVVVIYWGRVTHICVDKLIIIGCDNGLSPDRRQAIIWTNAGLLSIGPLRKYFSEHLIKTQQFSLKKLHVKMSSAKWRPSCLGLNVLINSVIVITLHRGPNQFQTPYNPDPWTSMYVFSIIVTHRILHETYKLVYLNLLLKVIRLFIAERLESRQKTVQWPKWHKNLHIIVLVRGNLLTYR